jgi:hypothetical protein
MSHILGPLGAIGTLISSSGPKYDIYAGVDTNIVFEDTKLKMRDSCSQMMVQ